MGRLLDRDARRRGRRHHHPGRHAAQLLPPTTTVDHLRTKRDVARSKAHVDVGFWGGALPDNVKHLRPLHDAGVFGFKAFLSPSGVDEFPELDQEGLTRSLAEIAAFDGLLIVHAEDPHHLAAAPQKGGRKYADFLASRPRDAEDTAIAHLIAQAERLHARVHVLHLSSSDALPLIAEAKRAGVRITVETCPHYLTLTAEEVPDGASEFKCCPPIREAANQDLLWQALADGTIDCVVTDHSPSTADLKTDDFATAWGGISGLQLSLSAVWTEAWGAATTWRTWSAGCPRARPDWSAWTPARVPSPWAVTPTSPSSPPTRPSPWIPPRCSTATGSRPTPAGRSAAS